MKRYCHHTDSLQKGWSDRYKKDGDFDYHSITDAQADYANLLSDDDDDVVVRSEVVLSFR